MNNENASTTLDVTESEKAEKKIWQKPELNELAMHETAAALTSGPEGATGFGGTAGRS